MAVTEVLPDLGWEGGGEEVEEECKESAGGIYSQGDPPDELLMEALLKVLQDKEADSEAGEGPCEVSDIADRRTTRLARVPVVDGEPHVGTSCQTNPNC